MPALPTSHVELHHAHPTTPRRPMLYRRCSGPCHAQPRRHAAWYNGTVAMALLLTREVRKTRRVRNRVRGDGENEHEFIQVEGEEGVWTWWWQWWCWMQWPQGRGWHHGEMEEERVKKAKSRKTAREKAWLGHAVGQAWHGWPSGVAGPRKLGLHILPKLLPHMSTPERYTTMGGRTRCSGVCLHECGGHMPCIVGKGMYQDGIDSNTSLGSWVCIWKYRNHGENLRQV